MYVPDVVFYFLTIFFPNQRSDPNRDRSTTYYRIVQINTALLSHFCWLALVASAVGTASDCDDGSDEARTSAVNNITCVLRSYFFSLFPFLCSGLKFCSLSWWTWMGSKASLVCSIVQKKYPPGICPPPPSCPPVLSPLLILRFRNSTKWGRLM